MLMIIGSLLTLISTLYIVTVSVTGWYSHIGDALGAGIGVIGCLVFLVGMFSLHL
jgi:hypothetical protein